MVVEAMASQLTTTFCAFTQVAARTANASERANRVVFNLSLLERQEARRESVRGQKEGRRPTARGLRGTGGSPHEENVGRPGKSIFSRGRKRDWSWERTQRQSGTTPSPH